MLLMVNAHYVPTSVIYAHMISPREILFVLCVHWESSKVYQMDHAMQFARLNNFKIFQLDNVQVVHQIVLHAQVLSL